MKVIFVNRYFYPDISATSQLLTDLAVDQAARGAEVHVVTSRQLYEDPRASLAPEARHDGVHVHRVATTRFGRGNLAGRAVDYATFYLSAARMLGGLADAESIIVAKTDPPLISVVAAWVARRRGARLVNWLQDVFPEVADKLGVKVPFAGLARSLRDGSLRRAQANVAVGELMGSTVARLAPAVPAQVIENWADGGLVRPVARESNPLRAEWSLEDRFVVGYSGNMGRAHEFETILQACEALRDDARTVFLFTGAGRAKAWIEEEARRRSLANVRFQPHQPRERLAASLSVADVHLVTLRPELEGLIVPSKLYGIAAAGRPAIFVGDPEGEIARAITGAGCGLAFARGDAAGLAAAIARLRDDPDRMRDMGAAARVLFEARHDKSRAMLQWNQLLASLGNGAAH